MQETLWQSVCEHFNPKPECLSSFVCHARSGKRVSSRWVRNSGFPRSCLRSQSTEPVAREWRDTGERPKVGSQGMTFWPLIKNFSGKTFPLFTSLWFSWALHQATLQTSSRFHLTSSPFQYHWLGVTLSWTGRLRSIKRREVGEAVVTSDPAQDDWQP